VVDLFGGVEIPLVIAGGGDCPVGDEEAGDALSPIIRVCKRNAPSFPLARANYTYVTPCVDKGIFYTPVLENPEGLINRITFGNVASFSFHSPSFQSSKKGWTVISKLPPVSLK